MKNTPQKGNISVLVLVIIAILAGIGGYYFGQSKNSVPTTQYNPPIKQEPKVEATENLLVRCGDFPKDLVFQTGHFTQVTGPAWSSDCRHFAWARWESGTSDLSDQSQTYETPTVSLPPSHEGVFLYDDRTQKIEKVYTPKTRNETPQFLGWKGNDKVEYSISINGEFKLFLYDIKLKTTQPE